MVLFLYEKYFLKWKLAWFLEKIAQNVCKILLKMHDIGVIYRFWTYYCAFPKLLRASCGFDSRRECQKILNAKAFRIFTFSLLLFQYYLFTITFSLFLFQYYFFSLYFSLNSHSGFYVISKSEWWRGVCVFLTSLKVSFL